MKRLLLFWVVVTTFAVASAHPVGEAVARRVAETYLSAQGMKDVAALENITAQTPFTEFYIFAAPQGGFILVSGDDCTMPVLAYSTTNRFETKSIPSHVLYMLSSYEKEIRWRKSHASASATTSRGGVAPMPPMWEALAGGVVPEPPLLTAVSPMLTTTWNQSPYYNNLCPDDNSGRGQAVTGCVATATAQVMKYHSYPTTGYGSHTYSSTRSGANGTYTYNNLTADFGATTYQWSQMPSSLTGASSTAQVNAVATLMYHIGVADEMKYSPEASGAQNYNVFGSMMASSQSSLMAYFKYAPDMVVLRRGDESDSAFAARLRAELDQSRPVLYSGSDTSGGHSFVLDGYNASGLFHVNWGWGGYQDGYYAISLLSPGSGGTGGNGTYTFNLDNVALTKIRPSTSWSTTGTTTVSAAVQAGSPAGCAVAVSYGGSGSSYGTAATTFSFGDTVMLLATAPEGCRFAGWSDGDHSNPREFLATGGSYTFTATFATLASDTASYCPTNACFTSYGLGSDPWGVKLPASVLDTSTSLSAVQFFANNTGTYNISVYGGSAHTLLATASYTVGSAENESWVTAPIGTPVPATQDLWIMLSAPGVSYPASFTSYSGVPSSCVVGTSFSDYGSYWLCTFMIKGIFSESESCVVSTFPYSEGFEDVATLGCWHLLDNDGDGYNWSLFGVADSGFAHNSDYALVSASWDDDPLTPDNWLFMPALQLPAGSHMHLTWYTKGQDPSWSAENYSVLLSTAGGTTAADLASYTTLASGTTTAAWVQHNIDLSAYAGQTVYIAFRHHNITDMFRIMIDDVEVADAGAVTQQYTITVLSNDPTWGTVSGGGLYALGTSATLVATPAAGFRFLQWDDGNTSATRTVLVSADATYTALFEPTGSCPTVSTFPYEWGFDGTLGCWTPVDNNADNSTWRAVTAIGSEVLPHSGSAMAASFSWNSTPFNADEYLVSPQFALPAGHTVTLSWWFKVNGNYPADKLAVKVSTSGNAPSNFTTTLVDITPTAANGSWTHQTVDLSAYAGQTIYLAFHHHDSYDNNYILIDDLQIVTSAAPMPTQYTLTVESNNPAWGTVTGSGTYNEGSVVILTATANSGYRFVRWQDGNTNATRSVTVTADATYTATFEAVSATQYTLTVLSNNPAWGSVAGGGTYDAGTVVTLIATPASGYQFAQWQDGNTSATRSVTVTADATYIATFEAVPAVGISDVAALATSVYPNPSSGDVTVTVSQPSLLALYDLSGRRLMEATPVASSLLIPRSELPAGVYILRITAPDAVAVHRLVIQ